MSQDANPTQTRLTPARLFADPPLTSATPQQVRFDPTGRYVSYLLLAEDDRERMDLWLYDCEDASARVLLDARNVATSGQLSEADRHRLERQRMFVGGVTTYRWLPQGGSVLVPLAGQAYLVKVADGSVIQLAENATGDMADLDCSPDGNYLSFVRSGSLFIYNLKAGDERQVSPDATDTVTYGLADFIAQEEMHRFKGYWWAPDTSALVYTRVDTAPIPLTQRQEIHADGATTVAQRYPYAGGPNAEVTLCRFDLTKGRTEDLEVPIPDDGYLARVNYVGDNLYTQVQNRSQQQLKLLVLEQNSWRTVTEEHSDTWVNLHDNLAAYGEDHLLWTSEANDLSQLVVIDKQSGERRMVATNEPLHITELLGVHENTAFVSGWANTPTENHLYTIDLETGSNRRISPAGGWNAGVITKDGTRAVFSRSSTNSAPVLLVHDEQVDELQAIHSSAITPTHPYFPYLDNHQTPIFGTVAAEDGQTLHYRLTPPIGVQDASSRKPVIVYVYGGPGAQKVKDEWPPLLVQLFAHAGYGVFELDNRGSTNRGRAFEAPIYKSMGGPEVTDQLTGVAALNSFDWVDPERIGVFGHSYGGFMTLMCLCQAGHVFKAGAAVAPVSDWRLYDTHYTERYLGHPEQDVAAYEQSAVLPVLSRLERPLLLIHGMADDNVLLTHSTMIIRDLVAANKPFELMMYPGSRHALQERDVSTHRFELILDFFARKL